MDIFGDEDKAVAPPVASAAAKGKKTRTKKSTKKGKTTASLDDEPSIFDNPSAGP